jgi:hypothetical protein
MAICGYNEKIGNGLKLLLEGMIESLEKKMESASADAVLQQELVELDNIIDVLKAAPEEVLPKMFVGLNLLAQAMFLEVKEEFLSSDEQDLGSVCRMIGSRFVDLLAETERRHQELRSFNTDQLSIAEHARSLARWALQKSSSHQTV